MQEKETEIETNLSLLFDIILNKWYYTATLLKEGELWEKS